MGPTPSSRADRTCQITGIRWRHPIRAANGAWGDGSSSTPAADCDHHLRPGPAGGNVETSGAVMGFPGTLNTPEE